MTEATAQGARHEAGATALLEQNGVTLYALGLTDSVKGSFTELAAWTGGSANMIAVKEALAVPDAVFAPMVIVDTVVPYLWMGLLIAMVGLQPAFDRWNRADRAILVKADRPDTTVVARILVKIIEKEQPDFVIMGKQATDDDSNEVGQMLAQMLGWPQATFISKLTLSADKTSATAMREVDGGMETVKVKLPAVVTSDLRLNEPRYVTLPNIMKAKKKPLEVLKPADLGVDVAPRIKTLKVSEPPKRGAGVKLADVAELASNSIRCRLWRTTSTSTSGVRTYAGQMALAVMRWGANSTAKVRVSPIRPCLAAT